MVASAFWSQPCAAAPARPADGDRGWLFDEALTWLDPLDEDNADYLVANRMLVMPEPGTSILIGLGTMMLSVTGRASPS